MVINLCIGALVFILVKANVGVGASLSILGVFSNRHLSMSAVLGKYTRLCNLPLKGEHPMYHKTGLAIHRFWWSYLLGSHLSGKDLASFKAFINLLNNTSLLPNAGGVISYMLSKKRTQAAFNLLLALIGITPTEFKLIMSAWDVYFKAQRLLNGNRVSDTADMYYKFVIIHTKNSLCKRGRPEKGTVVQKGDGLSFPVSMMETIVVGGKINKLWSPTFKQLVS